MRALKRVGLLAAVSLFSSGMVASPAAAAPGCGSVITMDTVLTSDVGPCNSDGLRIGASNVTLDLNGHTISGVPGLTGEGVGVVVRGKRGVVVKNGTIRDFDTGVLLRRSKMKLTTNTKVVNLAVLSNGLPQPSAAELGNGIALFGANNNLIEGNTVSGNIAAGISAEEATGNTIRGNRVNENGRMDQQNCLVQLGLGIRLLTLASGNTIVDNEVSRNTSNGVNLSFDDTRNLIHRNTINGNQANGLRTSADSNANVVSDNLVTNNGVRTRLTWDASGACVATSSPFGSGIVFDFSADNAAENNRVMGNALDGIRVAGGDETLPVSGSLVQGNTVTDNGRNGIVVTCTTDFPPTTCLTFNQHNTIRSNTATGNGGASAGTKVFAGPFLVGSFDLLDTNNSDNPTYTGPACDNNTWSNNSYDTAFPTCTTGP